jgi:hypothetical protein
MLLQKLVNEYDIFHLNGKTGYYSQADHSENLSDDLLPANFYKAIISSPKSFKKLIP